MIRYHGGPCTPIEAALELWSGRHALISYAYPQQIDLVAKHAFSFAMDNGAFSAWSEAMEHACDKDGRPLARLWGLRQMDSYIFSHVPYSFVDSSRIARSCGVDKSTPKRYKHLPPKQRALMMAFDADRHKSADRWTGSAGIQANMGVLLTGLSNP